MSFSITPQTPVLDGFLKDRFKGQPLTLSKHILTKA